MGFREVWGSRGRSGSLWALVGVLGIGCVNRGMHAPDADAGRDVGRDSAGAGARGGAGGVKMDAGPDANPGASGGSGGHTGGPDGGADAGPQSDGSIAAGVGGRGAGGTAGSGAGAGGAAGRGAGGTAGTGAGGRIMDAGAADLPRTCAARFNFENGNRHGAFINTGFQTAFTMLGSTTDAACGNGALRLETTLTPTGDKGEVIVPLGATEDVSGKTFSISVKSSPAGTPNAYVIVFLVPSYAYVTAFAPVPGAWTASTVTLPSGADAGTRATTALSVQLLGQGDSYAGALLLDEIDLR